MSDPCQKEPSPFRYGLIGEHLGHSYSKKIHESMCDYTYDLCELAWSQLQAFFKERTFSGINVTIPYKKAVIPYLDEQADSCRSVQACNCIVNRNGKLTGYNTDYDGIAWTFEKNGISVKGKKVLILGNGGVMAAYKAYAKDQQAADIQIVYYKDAPGCISMEEAIQKHSDAQILINATPVGMYPNVDAAPADLDQFPDLEFVCDPIYNPFETTLLQQARQNGIPHANGLWMLVVQAWKAAQLFTDAPIDEACVRPIWHDLMQERANLVLIGMPSSGKSSLARLLCEKLQRPVVEIDDLITEQIGMPIADYFARYGEAAFRAIEKEVTAKAAAGSGQIISCGGGVVLDPDNISALSRNGLLFYIDRPVELLFQQDPSRPTLKNGPLALHEKRHPLYLAAADHTISNAGSLEEAAEAIAALWQQPESFARFD